MDDYLTVREAANIMRVGPMTVYRMIWAGELPRINIGTGKKKPRFRTRRSAVDEFMARREQASKPPTPRPSPTPRVPRPSVPPPPPPRPAGPAPSPRPAGPKHDSAVAA